MIRAWTRLPVNGSFKVAICLALLWIAGAAVPSSSQTADTLPAFKPDSAIQDPFRKVEAGPSPWSAAPTAVPKTRADSAAADTVTERLRKRHPAFSVYLGVDFMDFDAKDAFRTSLAVREARDSAIGLKTLQDFEPVHMAFPIGLQAVFPVGPYLDVVAKTHSFWYKQTAVLGDRNSNHAGDEWYAVQSNLGGVGIRYYIPPSFLSVTGGLGLFMQGLLYWNLGGSELYTPYGSAQARFNPSGSAYEIQFGMQQALTGPWRLAGAIGFLQQDFTSDQAWTGIMRYAPPTGKAHWGSSAVQATLGLWYHFGVVADKKPAGAPNAAPADSSRRF
ncbi:MAG: hypothetical protein JWP91_1280 [Fibrobacteres bacterium]|nr:hypothetical protein [Fibrobacterota bacterium]